LITFRFYLVTLVAVFLAIALGVVIGSSFVEPRLVESLRSQVDSVQGNLDDRLEAIDELNGQVDDLSAFVDQAAPFAVDARLVGSEVVVVAEEGLDAGAVERLVGRLRQAGALTEGIVWLDASWQDTDDRFAELATTLDLVVDPDADIAAAAWNEVLLGMGLEGPDGSGSDETPSSSSSTTGPSTTGPSTTTTRAGPTTTTTEASGPVFEREVLGVLEDAGFVTVQPIDGGEPVTESSVATSAPELAVVFVTGPASDHGDDGALVASLARQQAVVGVPTVVAESYAEGDDIADRGTWVGPIRGDGELGSIVATVDDLDLTQGRVAAVLAIADLGRGIVGHYGYGAGAERVLPEYLGGSGS
jgi:hypothetical protein